MDDLRFGSLVRVVRIRRRWRQRDLAERAGVSEASISRLEHGRVDELTVAAIRRICQPLGIGVDLQPRGKGADLDRVVNARHSALHESVARSLARDFGNWQQASEVSFNVWGERGIIDLLLWHPGRRALLIIELKTELVDPGDLLATMSTRRRLSHQIVADRGWRPATVSTWVIVARSRTNERRLSMFRTMLRSAFPMDGRRLHGWLADPVGSVAAMSLWRADDRVSTAPVHRVRRAAGARDIDQPPPGEA